MSRVTLQLTPDTERKLREKASLLGQTLEVYLQQLAEKAVTNGAHPTPAPDDTPGIVQWEGAVLGTLSRRELYEDVG
jgi:hypothetical protein